MRSQREPDPGDVWMNDRSGGWTEECNMRQITCSSYLRWPMCRSQFNLKCVFFIKEFMEIMIMTCGRKINFVLTLNFVHVMLTSSICIIWIYLRKSAKSLIWLKTFHSRIFMAHRITTIFTIFITCFIGRQTNSVHALQIAIHGGRNDCRSNTFEAKQLPTCLLSHGEHCLGTWWIRMHAVVARMQATAIGLDGVTGKNRKNRIDHIVA